MKLLDPAAIRARCDAATPGPWTYDEAGYIDIGLPRSRSIAVGVEIDATAKSDGDFIAHARADVPALLAYIHDLEQELAENDRRLRAEADVLRGVGCGADGDGPCGACRLCAYRRGAETMANDLQHRFALLLAAESERALTAEERLEQMARERDKEREEWAARRCECSASDSCKMARERDEARAKADTYECDWYAAKADFGTAMGKMRESLRAAEKRELQALAELDEARAAYIERECLLDKLRWVSQEAKAAVMLGYVGPNHETLRNALAQLTGEP